MTTQLTKGVIYSAVGQDYIEELIRSAKSLKKYHPDLPITAYVDHPHLLQKNPKIQQLFHQIITIPPKPNNKSQQTWGRYQKVISMKNSPYITTLYLDVDTRIIKPITNLFTKLISKKQTYDLAIANSPKLSKTAPFQLLKYKKPQRYNSGVIVYNSTSPNMKKVFELWIKACENNNTRKLDDQGFLVDIINNQTTPVNARIIDNKTYNARHTMIQQLKKDNQYHRVKILHLSI